MHSAVALSLLSLGLALPLGAAAKCACGYRDPSTSMLYTDAIFTYFNESGAADQVVFDPTSSPSLSGHSGAGDTGTGNQNWATSQEVAFTENDFAATWRSAVAYNNTYLDPDTTKGLAMAVAPADLEHRISYGAGLVTRRRDILYGSFRTSIVPPAPCQGGTVLQMSATYNTSEHVTTAIYTTDIQANSTLQWSFSARDQASDPVSQSLSALGGTGYGFYEHRFEWLPDQLTFQNNATNATADFYALERKRDHVNLPSTPSPFSFKHWSNGARTGSQGPPVHHQPVANVVYARLFFNSSLPERNTEFEQQCAAAGGADVCDTEDYTLRDSTPFSLAATGTYLPPKVRHHIPLYSIICDAASGGIFVLLLIHALIKRYLKAKRAERAWIAEHGQPEKSLPNGVSVAEAELQETHDREIMTGDNGSGSLASDETKAEIDDAMRKWDDPSYMRGTDSDEESGFSSDSGAEDEDDPLRVNRAKNSLHSFGHGSFAAHGADGSTLPPLSYVAPQYRMTTTRPSSSVHGLMPPAGSSTGHELRAGASSDRGHGQRFGGSSLGHGLDYGSSLGHGQDDHDEEEIVEETGAMQNTRARHSAYGRAKPRRVPDAAAKGGLSRKGSIADIEVSSDEERGVKFAARPHAHASPANSRRTSISSHIHINSIMGDFPGPGSQDGHRWGGGLAGVGAPDSDVGHGNHGDAPIFRRAPSSYISHEGVDHQVRWNARIVPWEPASAEDAQQGGPLAAPKGAERPQTRQSVREDISRWRRFARSFFVGEGAGKATGSGAARVEYLDGLRGFACFLVSFHHFMLMFYPHVTTPSAQAHYHTFENYWRYIFGAVFTNGGLNVGIFFVLSARVIANRYLVRGKLQDLAEATHRRLPRLAVPISAGILLNYFAIEADMYHWVSHLPSRTWSTWAYFNDFHNLGYFINDYISLWFTIPPAVPQLITTYATGILWTVPVIVQASWTVFTCALIAREFKNHYKRYLFYSLCIFISWYNNTFDYFFLAGLIVADADNKLKYRERAAHGVGLIPPSLRGCLPKKVANMRVHGQVFAWIFFLAGVTLSYVNFVPGANFDFARLEYDIHPDYTTANPQLWEQQNGGPYYTDPRFEDFLFVLGFFLLCDLCASFRKFFQLRIWSGLGRNAFSLYLLHGVIFWSWGAWITLRCLENGVPYWAAILVNFITSYAILSVACELFTRTFDSWGVSLSRSFWRLTSGGIGRRI